MHHTVRHTLRTILTVQWGQFEGFAALRCRELATQVELSLRSLAAAVRDSAVPAPLPRLRQAQRTLAGRRAIS